MVYAMHVTFLLYINYNKYVLCKNSCMYCINDQNNIILWFINFDTKHKHVVSSKFMATSCRPHLSF